MRRCSKPSVSRHFLLPHALPFEFGDFFDKALQLLVIVHRLPDAGFPRLGDAELSRFSIVALDQIQGGVQFAVRAVAGGLAPLANTNRKGSAHQPVVVSQLGEPGTEVSFGRREAGAVHGRLLILNINNISDESKKQAPIANANLPQLSKTARQMRGNGLSATIRTLDAESLAGTLTVRKRFNRRMFFRANYSLGKSIDTASGLNYAGNGGYQGAQDSLNLNSERGRSDFDIRHVFSMNFAYQLPFQRNFLVRGWQVAGTGTAYSGQPLTPQLSGPSNDLAQATRPDRLSNGALDNPTANLWYSPAAFAIVPDSVFRYGNSGRNILDGPGSTAINISLSKWFQLAERAKAQFRWEAFNTTNHSNLSLPAVNLDKSNAGTITKARAARVMQVGVRYQFRTDNDDHHHA